MKQKYLSQLPTKQTRENVQRVITFFVIELSNTPNPSPNHQLHIVSQGFVDDCASDRCSSLHSPHISTESDEVLLIIIILLLSKYRF